MLDRLKANNHAWAERMIAADAGFFKRLERQTEPAGHIRMTQAIVETAKPLGISVHDQIIVGKEGHASLKGLKII